MEEPQKQHNTYNSSSECDFFKHIAKIRDLDLSAALVGRFALTRSLAALPPGVGCLRPRLAGGAAERGAGHLPGSSEGNGRKDRRGIHCILLFLGDGSTE